MWKSTVVIARYPVVLDCGGRGAKAPYPAPTTYQIEPDVCGQDLIFLILIL